MTLAILCCHIEGQIRFRTREALDAHAAWRSTVHVHFTAIDEEDVFQYGREVGAWWKLAAEGNFDLAIVEPDIVIREDVMEAFLNCECEYGGFPYSWGTDVGVALGCTRFRHSFITRYPDVAQRAIDTGVGFRQFDVTLQRAILVREHGEQPHICGPTVEHLNPDKQLRPDASPVPLATLPAW